MALLRKLIQNFKRPRIGKRDQWLLLGDSHTAPFAWARDAGLFRKEIDIVSVGGATAVGLRNPNSLTNAVAIFESAAIPERSNAIPIIHLGEVDCGFVIWWRSKKYGESIDEQLDASIEAYFQLVDRLLAAGYPSVVITGATMPTIQNNQDWGDVANKRRDVETTIQERTALTRKYNWRLWDQAILRGLPFVDISDHVLDPVTGIIADAFRHPDPLDHHLNPEAAGRLWARAINGIR